MNESPKKVLPELTLRDADQTDSNLILNSWLLSYEHARCGSYEERNRAAGAGQGGLPGRVMERRRYFTGQQALISALAARRRVLVVCDVETPSYVVGWVCGELRTDSEGSKELLIDFVYVKHAYRHAGVARELLRGMGWVPGMQIIASHWTAPCSVKATKYSIVYDDYSSTLGAI